MRLARVMQGTGSRRPPLASSAAGASRATAAFLVAGARVGAALPSSRPDSFFWGLAVAVGARCQASGPAVASGLGGDLKFQSSLQEVSRP